MISIYNCTLCGNCFACPFLEKYGYPKEIFFKKDKAVFICTNCGLCSRVCPYLANPSEALFSLKYELIKEDNLDPSTLKLVESSRSFVKKMSSFPFSYIDSDGVVFFPGCSLVSMGKEIVFKIKKWIENRLSCKVGLFVHCCGDPAFQNGDLDFVSHFVKKLEDKLNSLDIKKIYFGCANCKKIFNKYLPNINSAHLIELVSFDDIKNIDFSFLVHNPCPNFVTPEIKEKIDKIFKNKADAIIEEPKCCGLGGGANKLDKEVADKFIKRIEEVARAKRIFTFCMGCKSRLLRNKIESVHLYEYLTNNFFKEPVSDVKKAFNRLIVSFFARINLLKIFLFFLLLFSTIAVYRLNKAGIIDLNKILELIKSSKYLAPFIYILIYSIGPAIFFPSLILTIISGIIWGPFWGVIFSITGATIGCSVPFLLSRYLFYDFVKKSFGFKRWERLRKLVLENGWKVVAFTRLVPIFPFPILNYLYGITPIPFLHYVITSFIFMLPACIAYVYFGSSLFDLITSGGIFRFFISILLISLFMFIPYILKKRSVM